MKFLSVRELRNRPGRVWAELKREEMVLTSNGRPVGILLGVRDGRLEETLSALRWARAAAAVSRMRRRAAAAGTDRLLPREIETEVRAARRRGKS